MRAHALERDSPGCGGVAPALETLILTRRRPMRNAHVSSLKSRPQQWFCVCSNSVLSLLLFAFCLSVTAWCQDQATIVGVVSDSTSAVVTGAKVTVTNSQRGVKRETTSNSFGEYTVAKVPIGAYEITAEAAGF